MKQRVETQRKATNQTLNDLYYKLQNETETRNRRIHNDYMRCKRTGTSAYYFCCFSLFADDCYFGFHYFVSVALRKLEAKRQNVKGKIAQLEIKHPVSDETWMHTDFSTDRSAYNSYIKKHYLQEYEGKTPTFDGLEGLFFILGA